jgi:hypothetical protein
LNDICLSALATIVLRTLQSSLDGVSLLNVTMVVALLLLVLRFKVLPNIECAVCSIQLLSTENAHPELILATVASKLYIFYAASIVFPYPAVQTTSFLGCSNR